MMSLVLETGGLPGICLYFSEGSDFIKFSLGFSQREGFDSLAYFIGYVLLQNKRRYSLSTSFKLGPANQDIYLRLSSIAPDVPEDEA